MARDTKAGLRSAKQVVTSWLVLVAGIGFMLAVSFAVDPSAIESGTVLLSPTCPSKLLFGRECPTCGMTRGFSAMSHGHLTEALGYNRASPLVYAITWLGLAWGTVGLVRSVRAMRRAARRSPQR